MTWEPAETEGAGTYNTAPQLGTTRQSIFVADGRRANVQGIGRSRLGDTGRYRLLAQFETSEEAAAF